MGSASELGFGSHTFTSAIRTNGLSALESRSCEAHSEFCSLPLPAENRQTCLPKTGAELNVFEDSQREIWKPLSEGS
jgi:hypothetical protein